MDLILELCKKQSEGWHNWDKPDAEKTAFYGEYLSTVPGGSASSRVSWSHQLSDEDVGKYSVNYVFGDWFPM